MGAMAESLDPHAVYKQRLAHWRSERAAADRRSNQIGNLRLLDAGLVALLAWMSFVQGWITGWWLLIPLAVFIAFVVYHERVVRRQQFAKRAIAYYDRALLRLDDKWQGTGSGGESFEDPNHVYAGDLDVFGYGSLFELLSVARTAEGEGTLAGWLLAPASPDVVRERQQAVSELRDAVGLREDTALLGDDIRAGVHAEELARWGAAPRVPYLPEARILALGLALANIITFVGFMAHWWGLRPFIAGAALAVTLGMLLRRSTLEVIAAADTAAHDLQVLSLLLARLEREQFRSPLLQRLRAELDTEGLAASKRIGRLQRWMEFLDSSDHLLVRTIGFALLWRHQAAMGIEAWRRKTGPHVAPWIAAIAEFEALSSLAAFSFERPSATFPELVAESSGPLFEAAGLLHPLMSPHRCVGNDVSIGGERRLLIVSGSNMSGKSTLLRSVGLNAVLAWAGAPVMASRLRISPVAVGASIRIVDSLQDGKSRFYAEITRLRQIVELTAGAAPVLFLLDELLSGTNSHDRRIGAEAVIRTLVRRGAAGLVTTHDLALTDIQAQLDGLAANVHFEDHLEDGRMHFDYLLKPGVVTRSNALELMRAVGLDI